MMDMDSRVESLDDRLLRLQEEQIQQQQRTQATLHSTAALEQQLHSTEQKNEAAGRSESGNPTGTTQIHPQFGAADACGGEIASTGE